MAEQIYDRRDVFVPAPRPEWMKRLNELGGGLDITGVVPLTPDSLMRQATLNTGLSDFGEDDWLEPFSILMKAIDTEADLHLAGRILTRTEFLQYLESRLRIVDWYHRHAEVEREVIDRPVFITGYGRSGTTILFEVLAQDPRFRVAQKWEAAFPVPPPEPASYDADPRIAKAERLIELIRAMSPEHDSMHRSGADLPVESLELEYLSFVSEIFPMFLHVPSYAAYLHGRDLASTFKWQKTILKLLQSRMQAEHWLMKSPSHLVHVEAYLKVFPGMRVIFTHRDPVVTADSVTSFLGTLYWQRTDNPWGSGELDVNVLAAADKRGRAWDGAIAMIEDGRLPNGDYANFYYDRFVGEPMAEIRSVYDQLGMILSDEAADRMQAYLAAKTKGVHGKHDYEKAPARAAESERIHYQTYQGYFAVPNEI
ncbi:MAG TPA: sulfotransferase [Caulobacteraceae bacterium]